MVSPVTFLNALSFCPLFSFPVRVHHSNNHSTCSCHYCDHLGSSYKEEVIREPDERQVDLLGSCVPEKMTPRCGYKLG